MKIWRCYQRKFLYQTEALKLSR